MGKSVLYMSMSLDRFITGPHDGPGNGLGNAGHLLHEWLGEPVFSLRRFGDVMVHGADLARSLLREGLTFVLDAPGVTHLHYRVAT